MKVTIDVDDGQLTCGGCGLVVDKVINEIRREHTAAGPRLRVQGWGYPSGWENLRFMSIDRFYCPDCAREAGEAIFLSLRVVFREKERRPGG